MEGENMKLLINITSLLLICVSAVAQPDTLWTKTYGGSYNDFGRSVQQTSDGGYIIAGSTEESYGVGSYDVYLVKTDANGNSLWSQTFGGSSYDDGESVQQTSDGGYIIAGRTYSYGTGFYDVYLIKTDSLGNQQWSQTFGGSDYDYGESVQQTGDGGYIIAGYTESYGAGSEDVYLIKTDAWANEQWIQTFGESTSDRGYSVQRTSDGGYIITGWTESYGVDFRDVCLIKTDVAGNQQWCQTFGGSSYDYSYSVEQTSDGGYIIVGRTNSYGAGGYDVYLIKTDTSGNQQWSQTFGGSDDDYGWSVKQTSDGGYIIAGDTESYGAGNRDVYLRKTDSSGNEQWSQTYGGSSYDYGGSVQQTSNGGYIIAGGTGSYGAGGFDVWLIRLDSEGTLVEDFDKSQPTKFTLFPPVPNPFNPSTVVSYQLQGDSYVRLAVYDIAGREITRLFEGFQSAGSYQPIFNGQGLVSGIYFVRLQAGNFNQTQKVLLIK